MTKIYKSKIILHRKTKRISIRPTKINYNYISEVIFYKEAYLHAAREEIKKVCPYFVHMVNNIFLAEECIVWLNNHTIDYWFFDIARTEMRLKSKEDAIHFKLTWG